MQPLGPVLATVALVSLALVPLAGPGVVSSAQPTRGATRPSTPGDTARAGRTFTLEEAQRELDLVQPGRTRPAPDFTAPTHDGGVFRLAEHRGKVVLMNFWATWCPPCLEEMPALERLWQRQRSAAFTLVAISLDANANLARPYVAERRFTFLVALDPRLEVANAYGVRALPTTVVIDRQGTVRALALGPRVWDNDAAHALIDALKR
jgi:peroxiredoxin